MEWHDCIVGSVLLLPSGRISDIPAAEIPRACWCWRLVIASGTNTVSARDSRTVELVSKYVDTWMPCCPFTYPTAEDDFLRGELPPLDYVKRGGIHIRAASTAVEIPNCPGEVISRIVASILQQTMPLRENPSNGIDYYPGHTCDRHADRLRAGE